MDQEKFTQCSAHIGLIAKIVRDMPLLDYLNAIEHADTLGPILDPTLWMRGHDQMYKMRNLAQKLLDFQQIVYKEFQEIT